MCFSGVYFPFVILWFFWRSFWRSWPDSAGLRGPKREWGQRRREQWQRSPGGEQGVPAERKVTNSRMKHSGCCFPLPEHPLPRALLFACLGRDVCVCVWEREKGTGIKSSETKLLAVVSVLIPGPPWSQQHSGHPHKPCLLVSTYLVPLQPMSHLSSNPGIQSFPSGSQTYYSSTNFGPWLHHNNRVLLCQWDCLTTRVVKAHLAWLGTGELRREKYNRQQRDGLMDGWIDRWLTFLSVCLCARNWAKSLSISLMNHLLNLWSKNTLYKLYSFSNNLIGARHCAECFT